MTNLCLFFPLGVDLPSLAGSADVALFIADQRKHAEELRKQTSIVPFRLWSGGQRKLKPCLPETLYETAGQLFSIGLGSFQLYVLPDPNDIESRLPIGAVDPFDNAHFICQLPCPLVLIYHRPSDRSSPVALPAIRDEERDSGGKDSQGQSSGQRNRTHQTRFRENLYRLSNGRDFLTGAVLKMVAGTVGVDWEAAHIVPLLDGDYGNREVRCMLLEDRGLPGDLNISWNGLPLSKDHHRFFDQLVLSIDVENGWNIVVWDGVPKESVLIHALHDKKAALAECNLIAAPNLLKWHHQQCVDNAAATAPVKTERAFRLAASRQVQAAVADDLQTVKMQQQTRQRAEREARASARNVESHDEEDVGAAMQNLSVGN
jgi:hypothetical protein